MLGITRIFQVQCSIRLSNVHKRNTEQFKSGQIDIPHAHIGPTSYPFSDGAIPKSC